MSDIYSKLSEPFPQEMEKIINKGGVNLTYIPVSEVINRLNKVLGVDKWSMIIQSCHRDPSDPEFIVAHVRIEYHYDGFNTIVRDGFGGQKIKRTKTGAILDLGDEFKGAISDAVKKAAQTFGVGLYLARSEDAIEIEQSIEASNAPISEHEQKWQNFKNVSSALSKEQKELIAAFWKTNYSEKPKPKTADDILPEQLDALLAEAVRLQFDDNHVVVKN
jgi:recombination DNA repair RAD52 pathway protein